MVTQLSHSLPESTSDLGKAGAANSGDAAQVFVEAPVEGRGALWVVPDADRIDGELNQVGGPEAGIERVQVGEAARGTGPAPISNSRESITWAATNAFRKVA